MWKVFTTIWDTIIEDGMVFKKKIKSIRSWINWDRDIIFPSIDGVYKIFVKISLYKSIIFLLIIHWMKTSRAKYRILVLIE